MLIPLLTFWSALCLCPHGAQASSGSPADHASHCAEGGSAPTDGPSSPSNDSPCPHCGMTNAALGADSARAYVSFQSPSLPVAIAWVADIQPAPRSPSSLAHARRVLAPPGARLRTRVLLI